MSTSFSYPDDPTEFLTRGLQLGPERRLLAERFFGLALSEGLPQAHLGLAWLALWDDEPEFAIDQLRGFFSERQVLRADELFVHALLAVRRSGIDLPTDLIALIVGYAWRVSPTLDFLVPFGARGQEVRMWLRSGVPGENSLETSPLRANLVLATVVLSGSALVWRFGFAGPDWLFSLMPLVLVATKYNQWATQRELAQRAETVAAWRSRDLSDRATW